MVDGVQAYAKTAMQFARYVDRSRFDCHLYFTETTLGARPQESSLKSVQPHSRELGPKSLAEMDSLGAKVKFIPSGLGYFDAAKWLAAEMEADQIDGARSSKAESTRRYVGRLKARRHPRQKTLCLGINMYQEGQTATVYMSNP
jgi:hypothetical protein